VTLLRAPRLAVAGLSGDGGKTLVSLGLARALVDRGLEVRPFKKGPDYIDAAWLAAACGHDCRNLDTFLMDEGAIAHSVASAAGADLLLVEGNRGLFDGVDAAGSHSTAALARLLALPVVLVINVTKMTRTAAALALGCRQLDPELILGGVVLNRVATARQERVIRGAMDAVGIEVLGAIPRLRGDDPLPGRHLGLVTAAEHPQRDEAIRRAAVAVAENVDVDRVLAIARGAPNLDAVTSDGACEPAGVTVGYLSDEAFSFYYPENLERLRRSGARLVATSPARDRSLPEVEALYIGGGFPEVHAPRLADNATFAASLRTMTEHGLPVYAECGGLMYLARELVVGGVTYPMAGVLDVVVEHTDRPRGHGYEVGVVDRDNPFFTTGTELRGHEFHYSHIVDGADRDQTVLSLSRGTGTGDGRDGIVRGRVWASYLHLHDVGTPQWADGLLDQARHFATERSNPEAPWG